VSATPAANVKAEAPAIKAVKTATKATTTVKSETKPVATPKIVSTQAETLPESKPVEANASAVKAEATTVDATKSTEEKPALATPVTNATTTNDENKLSVTGLPANH